MRIKGIQKLTLLDYPGRTACTVFTGGCDLRCPFCQNPALVTRCDQEPDLPISEVLAFLEKRRGLLDGVCVSGGEPLLQPDLAEFLAAVKSLGYAVKLDSNGSHPERLQQLLQQGLADYVAMDIKNCPQRYAETTGRPGLDIAPFLESAALLRRCGLPYEFRTTVCRELHGPAEMEKIGRWLAGDSPYYIQPFRDTGDLVGGSGSFSTPSREELEALLAVSLAFLPHSALRGVD